MRLHLLEQLFLECVKLAEIAGFQHVLGLHRKELGDLSRRLHLLQALMKTIPAGLSLFVFLRVLTQRGEQGDYS